ncbi:MAG TPA: nitroreductase family protein [Candidatus Binataceae bacterium]|nr:nitroreductase family protein [Candidatus Binataceae bacterium]
MAELGIFEVMYSTRALRRFKPDPVPDDVITKLIEAGTRAASGSNDQNWVFIAVTDASQRARVGGIYQKAADRAHMPDYIKAKFGGADRTGRLIAKSVVHLVEHIHEAPLLLVACLKSGNPAAQDPKFRERMGRLEGASIYPAVQNIMLACRALGLGTVLTTLHGLHEEEMREVLGLPIEYTTWALLPIGYPTDKFGPVKRKPVTEVAYRDRFGSPWPK